MAAGTLYSQAEKSHGGVVDCVLEPNVAVEHVPVPRQETGSACDVWIVRRQFVTRQHFDDHLVVAFVLVDGFDDPVAPVPDVPLAVAHLVLRTPSVPIAVAPDVHPVPSPSLAIERARQQLVHYFFVRV